MPGVIDIHIHVQPGFMLRPEARSLMERDGVGVPYARFQEDPSVLVEALDRWDVEAAGVINYVAPEVMGFTPEVNDWCARYCAGYPDRLWGFGSVHPRVSPDVAGETRRVLDLGLRGLKLHPPHQGFPVNAYRTGGPAKAVEELYAVAQERRVPVMIHTGTSIFPAARNVYADPMSADDVAVDFPGLTLILAHAGRPLHCPTAVFLARRHPNVYLDISGIPPSRLLHYIPDLERIAGKVLWGTDWPGPGVPDPAANVRAFMELGLTKAAVRAILGGNARKLFVEG